ncbi:hypothetical protein [Kaistia sp. MMO-174]|uniref:hypothetical protein n=1 Tax=Kaistia sp. MMO-174 TaxID=3081256 RepID=UPI003017770E
MTTEKPSAAARQPHPDDPDPFLRFKLDQVAGLAMRAHGERVAREKELLEANNRYLERARAAEARVRELEEALKPFADAGRTFEGFMLFCANPAVGIMLADEFKFPIGTDGDGDPIDVVTLGDLRRAARLLGAVTPPPPIAPAVPEFKGFGIKASDGAIDIRTVSPTERAAKVNGLHLAGHFVKHDATDGQIETAWTRFGEETGNRIVPVLISEATK